MNDARPLAGSDLIVPAWPAPPSVHALMTTRRGGISTGRHGAGDAGGLNLGAHCGDVPERVRENRRRLARFVAGPPVWLRQVHGTQVVDASEADLHGATADASYADRAGIVCTVLVADCAPVLLADRDGTRVAAAHAGWRGLAGGVLAETLRVGGFVPDRTLAWIGPCIGPTRFEVGADVRDAFIALGAGHASAFVPGAPGKWWCDLPALVTLRLQAAGVTAIFASGACTVLDAARFYSYRRDGVTGRMAATIWIDQAPDVSSSVVAGGSRAAGAPSAR